MQKSSIIFQRFFAALLICGFLPAIDAEETKRDAAEVLRRVIERSASVEVQRAESAYAYDRATMVLFYDEKGKLKKQTDRRYQVYPEGDEQVMRLVEENGEVVKEDNETARQNNYSKTGAQAKRLDFDEELIQRYEFQYLGDELINGRKLALLSFKPKANPPEDGGVFGKLLNEVAGKIWVDLEDDQLARVEVKLLNRVRFFGGIAGAVEKMDMRLIRERVAPGVWLNGSTQIEIQGRKLLSPLRFKAFENCTAFRLVTEMAQSSPN